MTNSHFDGLLDQLRQLTSMVSDGDLISKTERNILVAKKYAASYNGWNIITENGIKILSDLKLINH